MLQPYHDPNNKQCLRANHWLSQIDPTAFFVWNGVLKCHEIWSRRHGRGNEHIILRVETDSGIGVDLESYRKHLTKQLREMLTADPKKMIAEIEEHNDRLRNKIWRERMDAANEDAAYVRKAVIAEVDGASRYSRKDVMLGLRKAHGVL